MADDVQLNSGSGGDVSRAKQKGAPKTSVVIVDRGGSGTENLNPFPNDRLVQTVNSAGLTITSPAYSAGDQVGTIFTFPNCAHSSGGGGIIEAIMLGDIRGLIGLHTAFILNASPTLAADNAAFTLNTAGDIDKLVPGGIVQLGPVTDLGTPNVASIGGLAIPYACAATSLFVALRDEVGHAVFTAVGDLHLTLAVNRDG